MGAVRQTGAPVNRCRCWDTYELNQLCAAAYSFTKRLSLPLKADPRSCCGSASAQTRSPCSAPSACASARCSASRAAGCSAARSRSPRSSSPTCSTGRWPGARGRVRPSGARSWTRPWTGSPTRPSSACAGALVRRRGDQHPADVRWPRAVLPDLRLGRRTPRRGPRRSPSASAATSATSSAASGWSARWCPPVSTGSAFRTSRRSRSGPSPPVPPAPSHSACCMFASRRSSRGADRREPAAGVSDCHAWSELRGADLPGLRRRLGAGPGCRSARPAACSRLVADRCLAQARQERAAARVEPRAGARPRGHRGADPRGLQAGHAQLPALLLRHLPAGDLVARAHESAPIDRRRTRTEYLRRRSPPAAA